MLVKEECEEGDAVELKEEIEEIEEKEKKKKFKKDVIQVGIFGIICYLFFFHVISIGHTISGSMEPTISSNAFVFGLRIYYSFEEPKRGDIVAVKPDKIMLEEDKKGRMVVCKRLVGLPGDKIDFQNGDLYINGIKMEEEYLYPDAKTYCARSFEVPEDSYFLMGDNREGSFDSRFWENTYVSKEDLISKIFFWINF